MGKLSGLERAEVLTQALPYIKHYSGRVIVVKYGGNAMKNDLLREQVMEDIILLRLIGVKVVLVHGGGPDISDMMNRLGKKPEFVDGLRVTDRETAAIVQMVLAGKVNKDLVNLIDKKGGAAVGISGIDGRLICANVRDPKLGFVGDVTEINIKPVTDLIEGGYIPVICTVGTDGDGNVYNVNGDTAAAFIAGALDAESMILMTDVPGVLLDKNDRNSLVPEISVGQAEEFKKTGVIAGGMIPKIDCCVKAIEKGVRNVVIMDGTVPHAILTELLTDEGAGTLIKK